MRPAYVVGVGMTKFEKPQWRDWGYPDMAKEVIGKAIEDSGVPYEEIEQACVGYVYGESTCGQGAVYQMEPNGWSLREALKAYESRHDDEHEAEFDPSQTEVAPPIPRTHDAEFPRAVIEASSLGGEPKGVLLGILDLDPDGHWEPKL